MQVKQKVDMARVNKISNRCGRQEEGGETSPCKCKPCPGRAKCLKAQNKSASQQHGQLWSDLKSPKPKTPGMQT